MLDARQLADTIRLLVQAPIPIDELVRKVAKALPATSDSNTVLAVMNLIEHGYLKSDRHRRICPA